MYQQIIDKHKKLAATADSAMVKHIALRKTSQNTTRTAEKRTRSLSFPQRMQIYDKLANLDVQVAELKRRFHDLEFEMEQTAELEGGKNANKIGAQMDTVLKAIEKRESDAMKLRSDLAKG